MEGFKKMVASILTDHKLGLAPPSSSSLPSLNNNGGGGQVQGLSTALSSSDDSRFLLARPPRNMVSLLTCSKLCAICFAAGVIVGFTLKRRVRRWASKLLKRLRDD